MSEDSQSHNLGGHDLEELLAGYVLGNLDEEELIWLNQQLLSDPSLRVQISELESALTLMSSTLPADVPQNDLRSQILQRLPAKTFAFKSSRWLWIISVFSALLAVCLGVNNFSLRQQIVLKDNYVAQQQKLVSLLLQPDNRLVSLQGSNQVETASGSLFLSPVSKTAVLALKNLQPLSGKQVYRLWAISQHQKIGCANFVPDAQGVVYLELSTERALSNANSILITIEPEADTKRPLGREFMTGSHSSI